jgi:hypothetical protein
MNSQTGQQCHEMQFSILKRRILRGAEIFPTLPAVDICISISNASIDKRTETTNCRQYRNYKTGTETAFTSPRRRRLALAGTSIDAEIPQVRKAQQAALLC